MYIKNSILIFSAIFILATACNLPNHKDRTPDANEIQIDSLPGECPFLTSDARGNTVLSWVRMINDSLTSFCYAVSVDGKSFAKTIVIPATGNIEPHGENLPKIVFKTSGEILALWGAANPNPHNKYSGLVYYVQSFDDGKNWTLPRPLISDTNSYDQRYYDIAVLPGGEVGAIWLDNRKTVTSAGSGLYFASTRGTAGFANDRLISQPCCQCCRTDLFIDSHGTIHTLYRGILHDSIRDMVHASSTDGGKSFSKPTRISDDNWVINGCPHTGPSMTELGGLLAFAWFTGGKNKGCYSSTSAIKGSVFTPRMAISSNGSHPQLTAISENKFAVVWDENIQKGDRSFKRIGLLKRTTDGIDSDKRFITSDTGTAAFPVIRSINNKAMFIAYTTKKSNRNYIAYQSLSLMHP